MRLLHSHRITPTLTAEINTCLAEKDGSASSGAYVSINATVTNLETRNRAAIPANTYIIEFRDDGDMDLPNRYSGTSSKITFQAGTMYRK